MMGVVVCLVSIRVHFVVLLKRLIVVYTPFLLRVRITARKDVIVKVGGMISMEYTLYHGATQLG